MKQFTQYPKVALDMYIMQMVWTVGFLGVMLFVNIVNRIIGGFRNELSNGFYPNVYISSGIYMLIIGIIAISFLSHYVGNGVTRKDYFKGGLLASIGLSITIPLVTSLIYLVERVIINFTNISTNTVTINNIQSDGNIIGDIVQLIVLSPYAFPEDHWLLSIFIYSINIFIFYLVGWFIGSSFYRFNTITGLGVIVIGIITILLKNMLIRSALDLKLPYFETLNIPLVGAVIGLLFIVLLSAWSIRQLTKSVSIKM